MLRTLRTKFGIPGVISVMALVFALGGAAYAAKKYVITSTAQIKPSVLKSLQGKAGAPGANGANGVNGAKGDPGAPGTAGAAGESVTNTAVAVGVGAKCEGRGGAELKVGAGAATFACNGKQGSQGPPGPVTTELPPDLTQTGTWAVSEKGNSSVLSAISFPLHPDTTPTFHYVTELEALEDEVPECPGLPSEPEAEPGNLCVYEQNGFNFQPNPTAFTPAGPAGVVIEFILTVPANEALAFGSWAVTACPEEGCGP